MSSDGRPPRRLNDDGSEVLDDTPVALPVRFQRAETLVEQVRRLVRGELSGAATLAGWESFDEADDFNVGDDYEPSSPHELDDDQVHYDLRADERYKRPPVTPGEQSPVVKGAEPKASLDPAPVK